ncbi:hypothetical protein LY90DRAFT_671690 [Neocallimastix californiae]|uniref:Uncharacterized protein n=1 Tax=Neocallimastix californiae TaxID=1754190 RepID=A0A1Y2CC54_9FUNG|nr:hypothetical protein LY90DRAFT_671690 [Neocallimastix californiae]|eukprot:ORY43905.1 hypothetical protein LY90DRAFT_671690 [Neocallimastix californiae]
MITTTTTVTVPSLLAKFLVKFLVKFLAMLERIIDERYNYHAKVPFIHELLVPFYLSEYHSCNGVPFGNLKGPYSILRRRLTGRYVHNYVVNYTKDFIKTYDGTNS